MDNKVKQKQTNMEQVKDVAKMFLHMDVGKTKFSPIIVVVWQIKSSLNLQIKST